MCSQTHISPATPTSARQLSPCCSDSIIFLGVFLRHFSAGTPRIFLGPLAAAAALVTVTPYSPGTAPSPGATVIKLNLPSMSLTPTAARPVAILGREADRRTRQRVAIERNHPGDRYGRYTTATLTTTDQKQRRS